MYLGKNITCKNKQVESKLLVFIEDSLSKFLLEITSALFKLLFISELDKTLQGFPLMKNFLNNTNNF